jgi:uncharacterized membrane protein YfcA
MPIDAPFLLVGILTVLAVSVGKGAFGGGLAILGVPLLSLVADPIDAAILLAPLVAFMDLFALNAFGRSTWSKPDLVWLLPGLSLGVALGTAVIALVDPRSVTLLIAAVSLSFGAHYFLRGRLALPGTRPVAPVLALLAGTASGFTTFIAHAGGPPLTMYLLRRGLDKGRFAGTSVAFFTLGNLLKLPPYLALGSNRPGLFLAALTLAPAVPLGVWLGKRLHDRLPAERLFFWCYVLLTAAAAKLLLDALRSFGP